jgi:membrane-bound serine protease (ClpP class)
VGLRSLLTLALFWIAQAFAAPAPVMVVPLEGAIGPASASFVGRGIKRAADEGAQLVVIQMDTPGGLDTSMRQIIKDILASPVPVAVYVAPGGARAASAGTFILYAAHIAAMAPGTNLGAASPVAIGAPPQKDERKDKAPGKAGEKEEQAPPPGDTMMRKQVHDAVAYIRSLAEMRGRNADWAERAVREAVSLPAEQALKMNVIDFVAPDLPALLKQLEGRTVEAGGQKRTLQTEKALTTTIEVDWRTRLLGVITNPSIAYVLVLVGIYALIFEFMNPGILLPGVVGTICLLLALYAFHLLPVNYAGLALILLGIAFMVAEAFLPAFGALGVGGIIAFALGSVLLIEDTALPEFEIPWTLIAGVTAASAAFLIFVVGAVMRGRSRPVVSGREQMLGARGEALADFEHEGWAWVLGERWRVRSRVPIRHGERVRVTAMEGLTLTVEPESGSENNVSGEKR